MISITRYDRLVSDIPGNFLIVQNTFDYNELYVIPLEEVDYNGRRYCYSFALPECMSFGAYNFWLTEKKYTLKDLNKLDVPNTILLSGNLAEIGRKPILIDGKQLGLGFKSSKICLSERGLLKHKRVSLYGCR